MRKHGLNMDGNRHVRNCILRKTCYLYLIIGTNNQVLYHIYLVLVHKGGDSLMAMVGNVVGCPSLILNWLMLLWKFFAYKKSIKEKYV